MKRCGKAAVQREGVVRAQSALAHALDDDGNLAKTHDPPALLESLDFEGDAKKKPEERPFRGLDGDDGDAWDVMSQESAFGSEDYDLDHEHRVRDVDLLRGEDLPEDDESDAEFDQPSLAVQPRGGIRLGGFKTAAAAVAPALASRSD